MGIDTWQASAVVLGYLGTFFTHSTLLIAATWVLVRAARGAGLALRERAWRVALVGAVLSAAVATGSGIEPLGGKLGLLAQEEPTPAAADAPAAAVDWSAVGLEFQGGVFAGGAPAHAAIRASVESNHGARPWWVPALAGVWALGAAVGIARLLIARHRLHRDLAGRRALSLGPAARSLALLQRGRAPVRLTSSAALAVPIALGVRRPEICLCERALAELSPRELQATLAHELGHLVRRDPLWLALAHGISALFWFQPLLVGVRRELTRLAELQADRFAARQTGQPLALASALTRVAAWWSPSPVAAHGMAGARFALSERVECLLDGRAVQSAGRGALATPVAALLLGALVTAAPAVSAGTASGPASGKHPGDVASSAAAPAGPVALADGTPGTAATSPGPRVDLQRELAEVQRELSDLAALLEGRPELRGERAEFALLQARFERIEFLREELETLLSLRAAHRSRRTANDVPTSTPPLRAASPFAR